jgi:prepilin-type N-terminal cleavage/methylation domain-containing protein
MYKNRKGFTLIELLIVVVIIGILAAIAIPKFASTKEKAYLATMKSDLRNLATAQEAYASDNNGEYMPGGSAAGGAPATPHEGYTPSSGVTVAISNAGAGWSATATHVAAPDRTCAIFVNTGEVTPATSEGEPRCD